MKNSDKNRILFIIRTSAILYLSLYAHLMSEYLEEKEEKQSQTSK